MQYSTNLLKMRTELAAPVNYYLNITNATELCMNKYIDKNIELHYVGEIYCIGCGSKTYKSFAQGYCYKCFTTSPETEACILKPELCRAHEGIARDMEFARHHCLQPHYVYLAASSDIKVGITRESQVPTRWIDQGAHAAIKLAKVPNRYSAGVLEVALKSHFPDKTNWRAMLTNQCVDPNLLLFAFEKAANALKGEMKQYMLSHQSIETIQYPAMNFPAKVNSLDFEKTPRIQGKLMAIKGQYLIFEGGNVLNIRKFGGYRVNINV
jgi:hypothetical protein